MIKNDACFVVERGSHLGTTIGSEPGLQTECAFFVSPVSKVASLMDPLIRSHRVCGRACRFGSAAFVAEGLDRLAPSSFDEISFFCGIEGGGTGDLFGLEGRKCAVCQCISGGWAGLELLGQLQGSPGTPYVGATVLGDQFGRIAVTGGAERSRGLDPLGQEQSDGAGDALHPDRIVKQGRGIFPTQQVGIEVGHQPFEKRDSRGESGPKTLFGIRARTHRQPCRRGLSLWASEEHFELMRP